MSEFLSVSLTANLLGVSKQAVQKACKEGKYTTQQVSGKGGLRYEIALDSLPKTAQETYFKQQADAVLATLPIPVQEVIEPFKPLVKSEGLSHYTSKQRDVDLAIKTVMRWIEAYPGTKLKALAVLDEEYKKGQLPSPLVSALERCRHKKNSGPRSEKILTPSTVENWQKKFKRQGNYIPMTRVKDMSTKHWHKAAVALYLGIGWGDDAEKQFGKYRIENITFSARIKEQLAYPVRGAMEDKKIRIPYKPEIRADLRAVTKVTSLSGNIRFTAERSENGHADRFWALALGVHAASSVSNTVSFTPMRFKFL